MNQMKNRLQGLTLLDRAFTAMTDEELEALVAKLPEDHRKALDEICGARDEEGFSEPATRTVAVPFDGGTRAPQRWSRTDHDVALRPVPGRLRRGTGDHADNPTEDELLDVTPALIEKYGLATVRLMMAGSVAGEAAASVALTRLLKHDETLALPPIEHEEVTVLPPPTADEEIKAKRKAASWPSRPTPSTAASSRRAPATAVRAGAVGVRGRVATTSRRCRRRIR
jgi:hypothetical protein